MNKKLFMIIAFLLLPAVLLSGCSASTSSLRDLVSQAITPDSTSEPANVEIASTAAPVANVVRTQAALASGDVLAALQDRLGQIYEQVNPSVVNIQVVLQAGSTLGNLPEMPGFPSMPEDYQPSAQGSGFVWDTDGHIVTNNHVVENADSITVVFSDGTTVPAEVVGTDPDSDLAVIKVDLPADRLQPMQVADSNNVEVGQLAVAIGNPFGLEGTMTVGFVSALERSLPVSTRTSIGGGSFSIPDIIQTDAPINPGNSGGVLVDDQGQLIGVPTAIESSSGQNAGIGFAVPSSIVQRVVPVLIGSGAVQHPWIGITATTLTSALAEAMGLDESQRGALVISVTNDSPAEKAELRGSTDQVDISGQPAQVGGDVIVAINGQPIAAMDELISYLAQSASVGDNVTLSILRDGKEMAVSLTLEARPGDSALQGRSTTDQAPEEGSTGNAWLGIEGMSLTADVAQAMDLDQGQSGVLVVTVVADSPADEAGVQGGYRRVTINGESLMVGGDVIVAMDEQQITGLEDLQSFMAEARPGQQVTLTVLRNGTREGKIDVTLGERLSSNQ
jgi:S1-C subfamily serine protease